MNFGPSNIVQAAGAMTQQQTVMPPTPATLVGAISHLDDLNKRLDQLRSMTQEIATAIGGPMPIGGVDGAKRADAISAIARLHDQLTDAHGTVTMLENAIGAIRRALGG